MANTQTPIINGVMYSWANVKVILFGVPVIGVTKITYKKKAKKENLYGQGSEPIGRSYGNNEYEASITLYRDEWNSIIKSAPNFDPLSSPFSEIQVVFGGSAVTACTDRLLAAEFLDDPFSVGQGDTKILVDIPLIIGGIIHVPA